MHITFPRCLVPLCVGKPEGSYVRTEVKPCYSGYMVYVTFQDAVKMPEAPTNPTRILGLDPGLDNFLTALTNFPAAPFIIDGHWLKSINQNFNRRRAALMSELTKGMDSTKSAKNSARLNRISKKRACRIDDFFYKAAHYIVDFCLKNKVEVIVCGHNKDQKQEINLGSGNNQHFVSIPYTRFFWILTCVAAKAGIPVIETEESYTSKASLIDKDPIPVYKEGDRLEYHFSGKRISRGQYESKEGTILNADVNGAGNIIRKVYPNALILSVTSPTRIKRLFELPREVTLPCETQEKTRQTTKKTWYEPMAVSSQAGTEACIFRTVQSKQCERQDQIYRRIKTKQPQKRRHKGKLVTGCRGCDGPLRRFYHVSRSPARSQDARGVSLKYLLKRQESLTELNS